MQIIKFTDGLGNQMFQYAFIKAYSLKNNCDFLLDLSWFEDIKTIENIITKRIYGLNCFEIVQNFATTEQIEKCMNRKKCNLPKFLRKILKKSEYSYKIYSDTHACVYKPDLLEAKKIAYFKGYFQSEKYFAEYRDEILNAFTLNIPLNEKNNQMLKKIHSTTSISLHVRREDYVNLQDIHGLCDLEYYKKAVNYMIEKIKDPHFFLFSDDIEWVKGNLKIDSPCTIVDINDEKTAHFDLELMKNCEHNIIANSSFSWWGAWLNKNPNKIVIAPQKWFESPSYRHDDVIPQSWMKI